MSSELKYNGWLLVPVLVVLVGLHIIAPSRVWMALIVALSATVAISWLWARQMLKHVSLTRENRYNLTRVGDRLEERFTLHNAGLLPALWAEVDDHSTVPGYHPDGDNTALREVWVLTWLLRLGWVVLPQLGEAFWSE